eukprot:CAMPEP_0113910826 /NCGR_PEP_ID=MMETSP0780_2-20120614/27780_1 /TAXON_ID=652834 /ORGANISM="Palpitomonas bilix" /LENGTH=324 /DNA_ID=CAMNT_0000907103 /DNA_START=52 /DNA_END=1026 /DNA_ORIENTATION=+ /assembly_acc=CAM_ASM_000599
MTSIDLQERREYDPDKTQGRHVKPLTIASAVSTSDLSYSSPFRSKNRRFLDPSPTTGREIGPGHHDPEFQVDGEGKSRVNKWIKPTFSPMRNRGKRSERNFMMARSDRGAAVSSSLSRSQTMPSLSHTEDGQWGTRSLRATGDFSGVYAVPTSAPDIVYDTKDTMVDELSKDKKTYSAGFLSTTSRLADQKGRYATDEVLSKKRERRIETKRTRSRTRSPSPSPSSHTRRGGGGGGGEGQLDPTSPGFYHDGVSKQRDMSSSMQRKWNARYMSPTFSSAVARERPVITSLAQKAEDGWGRLRYDDKWGATAQSSKMGALLCGNR